MNKTDKGIAKLHITNLQFTPFKASIKALKESKLVLPLATSGKEFQILAA